MYKNIYVLYGYPLKTSLSPIIHNSTLDKSIYFKQPVKSGDLEFAINAIRKFNWKGANITIPHKVKVVKYLDEIDESVKTTGAVNTIENVGEKLIGYNTDVNGFKDSLPLFNKKERAIIIGAGGAARAVVFALIKIGFKEIHIYNRTLNRSQDLKEFFLKL
ncbi:MAG: shikimate dehydrogenase family protein, partial [Halanaerobiales bacterium]